jgi:NAD(P)-dependent dehydrogenase (short-subunit alcohol dehydrogenase family)
MSQKRVIAVTGASRGIGACIVQELGARGFVVGCLSRKGLGPEKAEVPPEVAGNFINVLCDVTDGSSIKAALAELAERAGAIHGLVNNAGQHSEGKSAELSSAEFERLMSANATSVLAMCREVHPYLVQAGGGAIVNMGSYYDKLGVKYHLAYCASKAAVGAITRCLAVEWAREGIRVVNVAPGFVGTELNQAHMAREVFRNFIQSRIPNGRIGRPEEIARLVAAILAEDLEFLTGETIYIDGGQTVTH